MRKGHKFMVINSALGRRSTAVNGVLKRSTMIGGIVLIAILSTIFGQTQWAQALDPIPVGIASALQPGVVTSVWSQALFISGKEYTLDPEVEIRDQEDNLLQADVIRSGHDVKFHVKKGEGNKIDVLVVYMPQ